jgi:hypothetical protein
MGYLNTVKELKALKEENAKLKRLVTDHRMIQPPPTTRSSW